MRLSSRRTLRLTDESDFIVFVREFVTSRIEFFGTARMKPLQVSQTTAETDLRRQTTVARVMIDHLILVQCTRVVTGLNTPDEIGGGSLDEPRENSIVTIVLFPRRNTIFVVVQGPFLYEREVRRVKKRIETNRDRHRRVLRCDQWCHHRRRRRWCSFSSRISSHSDYREIGPLDRTSRSNPD